MAVFDTEFDPHRDRERGNGYEKSDGHFSKRFQFEKTVEPGIKSVGKQRDQKHHQKWVYRLHLARKDFEAEDVSVHLSGLEDPA